MTVAISKAKERAERVELVLAQLQNLPTLPAVATRVLELTIASDSSAREVVRLIESDQSLTAKILAMTRRAGTGAGHGATTVEKAVVLLGFDAIRNAVLSIKVFETFTRSGDEAGTAFDRKEFWKHSLAVACAAQLAAQFVRDVEPEQAFVCGLLHDIGKVALDTCLPKSYDRVVRRTDTIRGCMADVEREVLGVDHTVAGHRLAQQWRLPPSLTESIWLHHHGPDALPPSVRHAAEIQVVHFADRLARELRLGYSGNYHPDPSAASIARQLGLSTDRYKQIVAALADRIDERAQLIGLDRLTSHELFTKALSDANEELGRANEALATSNRNLLMRCRYFNAMNAMNQRLGAGLTQGEVCAAAAEAVRTALGGPAAVFLHSPTTGLVHAGLAAAADGSPVRSVAWDVVHCPLPAGLAGAPGSPVGVGFLSASAAAPALAERVRSEADLPVKWFCPVLAGDEGAGGLLIGGDDGSPARWADEAREIGSLVTAIRLWMINVEAQHKAQRLNEELSEINRRLQRAQGEAARARSLMMVADMAAGAAHELNNPLAVISGRAQMLQTSPPDEPTGRIAALLVEQAQRCSQIVAELMEFARPNEPQKRPTPLRSFVEALRAKWIDSGALKADEFVLELSDDLPIVQIDVSQVRSAFDELVRNALDAMQGGAARLVVNCQWEPTDESVVIRLEDNGRGMGPDTLERAMDPFYSQRPAGRGRGLGLSRAARWIEINAGRLRLDSREGNGTTVFVEFPVSSASAGA